mmetsp:Transcript_24140/g.48805  ORF Transcript_24140/g.48805 Transcript_24140/m.48805 type:complete len:431 (-) Transcript_24140:729-2021(-)
MNLFGGAMLRAPLPHPGRSNRRNGLTRRDGIHLDGGNLNLRLRHLARGLLRDCSQLGFRRVLLDLFLFIDSHVVFDNLRVREVYTHVPEVVLEEKLAPAEAESPQDNKDNSQVGRHLFHVNVLDLRTGVGGVGHRRHFQGIQPSAPDGRADVENHDDRDHDVDKCPHKRGERDQSHPYLVVQVVVIANVFLRQLMIHRLPQHSQRLCVNCGRHPLGSEHACPFHHVLNALWQQVLEKLLIDVHDENQCECGHKHFLGTVRVTHPRETVRKAVLLISEGILFVSKAAVVREGRIKAGVPTPEDVPHADVQHVDCNGQVRTNNENAGKLAPHMLRLRTLVGSVLLLFILYSLFRRAFVGGGIDMIESFLFGNAAVLRCLEGGEHDDQDRLNGLWEVAKHSGDEEANGNQLQSATCSTNVFCPIRVVEVLHLE